jgi:xanthine dehydrogenase accessory factor
VGGDFEPRPDDLALVVAGHGREELPALRRGLEAELPYVGLVASRRRGQGVIGELRGDGVAAELLDRIDTPAGLDIGARTPEEIAVSILARVVQVRRAPREAVTAVDPICGMTVTVVPGTRSAEHAGETVYFCGDGCKAAFELQHAGAD